MSDPTQEAGPGVQILREGAVASIVLNRPNQHNALTPEMMRQLVREFAVLAEDDDIRVVVLRGNGRSFCAGFDLAPDGGAVAGAVTNDSIAEHARLKSNIERLFTVWDFPKPVIASVHGYCLAGATMLASLCDLTVVADDAKIGVSSLPLGGGYITPLWMHLVGPKRAKQAAFQPGETISGVEAANWGWANYSVPGEDLHDETMNLARRIARTPLGVLTMKKHAINRICELQGFRAQAMLGAEMDTLLHYSNDVAQVWQSIHEHGLRETIAEFKSPNDENGSVS